MTKDEITRALRICGNSRKCTECPLGDVKFCLHIMTTCAADLIEQQAARIAELEAKVPRWIPVTERLPEIEQRVLVLDRHGNAMVRTLRCLAGEKGPSFRPDGLVPRKHITHWMPLQEPAETDGGADDGA